MQDEAQITLRSGRPDAAEEILTFIEPIWTGSIAYRDLALLARLQEDADTRELRIPPHPTLAGSLARTHGRQVIDVRAFLINISARLSCVFGLVPTLI